jgi:hypothetical protein
VVRPLIVLEAGLSWNRGDEWALYRNLFYHTLYDTPGTA